ncbi:hypothetical protein KFK09_010127 [Dendrobium nobile]|uniref:Uncharacterized protein n=1 Tax=Dendrobium nobile TaxID=94219 RepID=A0A8T3BNH7_DENNO|nr:hypothetical protein KFK09_010127 [Dendrobium nobile]
MGLTAIRAETGSTAARAGKLRSGEQGFDESLVGDESSRPAEVRAQKIRGIRPTMNSLFMA